MKVDKCISCFLRRKLGTADNLETTSNLLVSKIQKAKGSKFLLRPCECLYRLKVCL
jgi:hypothetical protein